MKRNLFLFAFLISLSTMAQNYLIKGNVIDKATSKTLQDATVQVMKRDSSFVNGTKTNNNGEFSIALNQKGGYLLKISYIGFKPHYKQITLSKEKPLAKLPTIHLETDGILLKEAVVKAQKIMFVTKKDTVIYDADAFLVSKGASLRELITKMPGIEIRDGVIYFKGKAVDRLLVNGEDFVKNNTSIALDNLPAFTIQNVKAYERQTDMAMATGIDDGERQQVIDITLRRKYMGTWTGNVDGGYGTDNYYIGRLFGNTFMPNWRVSVFGGFTNTGSYQSSDANGDWSDNYVSSGETTYKKPGVSFYYKNKKEQNKKGFVKISGSMDYDYRKHDDISKQSTEKYLNEGNTFSQSWANDKNKEQIINTSFNLDWNPDDITYIQIAPSFSHRTYDNKNTSRQGTWNEDPFLYSESPLDSLFNHINEGWPIGKVVNSQNNYSEVSQQSNNLNWWVYATRRLSKKNLRLSIRNNGSVSGSKSTNSYMNMIRYYQNPVEKSKDFINRYKKGDSKAWSYNVFLDFFFPITSKTKGRITYGNTQTYNNEDNMSYRLDSLGGFYADFDRYKRHFGVLPSTSDSLQAVYEAQNSLYSLNKGFKNWFEGWLQYDYKGLYVDAKWLVQPNHDRLDYQRGKMVPLHLEDNNLLQFVNFLVRYKNDSIGKFELKYTLDQNSPYLLNKVDIPDTEDPLNIRLGNPDLKKATTHRVDFSYDRSFKNMRYIRFGTYYRSTINNTVQTLSYNPVTGVSTTRPINVNGTWLLGNDLSFNTPLDKKNRWNLYTGISYDIYREIGYTTTTGGESLRNSAHIQTIRPRITAAYKAKGVYISVGAYLNYMSNEYSISKASNLHSWSNYYSTNMQFELPWDMSLTSSFAILQRNGYYDPAYNRPRYMWNASVSKSFLKDKNATIKLELNDLLKERVHTGANIDASSRSYSEVNCVQRFAMLHFIYRFSIKPKMTADN